MNTQRQRGFSLIELLVAATIFTFVVTAVTALFSQALQMQRRAQGIQKIDENAMFTLESMSREIRVSRILSGDAPCDGVPDATNYTLQIRHPSNGVVTYRFDPVQGRLLRASATDPEQAISAPDVTYTKFAFCVTGAEDDNIQARVTMPMTIQAPGGTTRTPVSVSLQTSVVSRDLLTDFGVSVQPPPTP